MSKPWKPTPHPLLGLPSVEDAMRLGEMGFKKLIADREEIIKQEAENPLQYGWEPPIWKVCDALLGFPWVDAAWAERMRRHLGFNRPVRVLLINGGNRAGKSEYAAKRCMRVLRHKPGGRAWAFHQNVRMSVDYQQPLLWRFMPLHLRRKTQTTTTYVSFKHQTGFAEQKFTMETLSTCVFKTYEQTAGGVEGANLDIVWPDELIPPELVETLDLRIAERDGAMIITFTPVQGYTETVKLFQDGAETVQESTAFLMPKDGGPPDEARALGLTDDQLAELKTAAEEKRAALGAQSVPENCDAWLDGGTGQPAIPPGREFERVPRVLKCRDKNADTMRACVFFHSSDNPYGNPKSVWATIRSKTVEFQKERFYGIANKLFSARFPKFNLKVHVLPPEAIPKEGTNYHFVDPHSARNFFMLWIRATADDCAYVYREWPGSDYIPGVGVPGPWAVPDGKLHDGRRGPGANLFGFDYLRYKSEIARLEGWHDYKLVTAVADADKRLAEMDEWRGTDEPVLDRYMDARFASVPKQEQDRPVTLLTEMDDIGLVFHPSPAEDIHEGVGDINAALYYDDQRPVDYFNKPRLYISADCRNLIYSLQTWTGLDGDKGACKDPVDCLRWFYRAGCEHAPLRHGREPEEELA